MSIWEENQIRKLAILMHNVYEAQAKLEGWKTQDSCKVEFDDLPEANKRVMLATAKKVWEFSNHRIVDVLNELASDIDESYWITECCTVAHERG